MKRLWVVGRIAAFGLTYALWRLSSPQEARAGTWVITEDFDGSKVINGQTQPWLMPRPQGYPDFLPWSFPGMGPSTSGGGGGSASTSGDITFHCEWTPNPSNPNERVPVAIHIPTMAIASTRWRADGPWPTNVTGLADDAVNQVTVGVLGVAENDPSYNTFTWQTNSSYFYALPGGGVVSKGSTKSWTIPVHLEANFSVEGMGGGVSVNADNPVEDNHSLFLTRGIPAKNETDPNCIHDRDEWIGDDGKGHGHTLASYRERIALPPVSPGTAGLASNEPRDVVQSIGVNRGGDWSAPSKLTYSWASETPQQDIGYQIRVMPLSNAINNPDGIDENLVGGTTTNFPGQQHAIPGWINTPSDKSGNTI